MVEIPKDNKTELGMQGFDNGNFSIFEHVFVLGSSVDLNGELINARALANLAKAGDVNAYEKLYTPVNILIGRKDKETVARERAIAARSTGREDFLQFIDIDKYLDFSKKGQHVWLEPSPLDSKTGLVVPIWKLHLISVEFGFVNDPEALNSLEITNGFGEWLELEDKIKTEEGKEIQIEDCFRMLSLNFTKPERVDEEVQPEGIVSKT